MAVRIPRVQRGQKIEAETWDRMCAIVETLANVRTGPGLEASFTPQGLLISLMGSLRDRFALCKITAAPPPSVAVMPADCKYGYQGLEEHGVVGTDVLPIYGRMVENEEIAVYPAKVGHLCAIFRNPQADGTKLAELIVFTESPARGPCGGQFRS